MTAPALPGAAPDPAPGRNDPARLPPEVEVAIQRVAQTCWLDGKQGAESKEAHGYLDALRTAIARALGGDGEPVAWQIVDVNDGPTGYVGVTEDAAWARMEKATWCSRAEWAKERHARPLFTRPAATGDTGEGGARG